MRRGESNWLFNQVSLSLNVSKVKIDRHLNRQPAVINLGRVFMNVLLTFLTISSH